MDALDPRTHIAHVALRVSDVDRSAAFYSVVAGLQEQGRDGDTVLLGAPAGGPALLRLRRSDRPGPAPRRAAGLFHTAFLYPTRSDLGTTLRRVADAGIQLTGASDHGVSEALYLDDPDGLGIELYRDRPRDQWPAPDPGARVGMYTIALDLQGVHDAAGDEADTGLVDVGHVHLKASDLERAEAFWSGVVGFERMTRFGDQATFLAAGGYHHHVGLNTWQSRGAQPEPPEGPGLDHVALAVPDEATRVAVTARVAEAGGPPDGIGLEVEVVPAR